LHDAGLAPIQEHQSFGKEAEWRGTLLNCDSDPAVFSPMSEPDEFLKTMELVVPWAELCEVIEPYFLKVGNGRPPIGMERMLRIHFIQHWFNLADLSCEEALYAGVSLDAAIIDAPSPTKMLTRHATPTCAKPAKASKVLWNEAAHRRGQSERFGPQCRCHVCQRA
jgi:hypothetical protein